jgi:LmbE family N-acetylglucosaminyl deacetylase
VSVQRLAVVLLVVLLAARNAAAASDAPVPLEVRPGLRLLVVAPHPDDEILGAGGLIQRVLARHGHVTVLYLTSGDGYLDGVSLETKKRKPVAKDFVDYGQRRLEEALRALEAVRISPRHAFFLGFPDAGLDDLLARFWRTEPSFVSPFTRDDRPPYALSFDRKVPYSGIALVRELAIAITRTRPDWIAVTAPWDVHPDHCAANHFVVRTIHRLATSNRRFRSIRLLLYTIHRPDWPVVPDGAGLSPPAEVDSSGGRWKMLSLTSEELERKGQALDQYTSQMEIMAVLFRNFVRSNEVFAEYEPPFTEPSTTCELPTLSATSR